MTKVTKKAAVKTSLGSKVAKAAAKVPPHVIVIARAGTGKTTTLIEGMKVLRDIKPDIDPSPQQRAIWDELLKSKGAYSIAFAAFGKAIADDLQDRIKGIPGCEASTLHRMGSQIVRKAFPSAQLDADGKKMITLLEDYYGHDIQELRKLDPELIYNVIELTSKAKMSLVDSEQGLRELIEHFSLDIQDAKITEVITTTREMLKMSQDLEKYPIYNFDDMIWLPVVLGLPVFKFDVLMVDECFPAGTIIETSAGLIPIEKIVENEGDYQVLASQDGGQTLSYSKVTAAYKTLRKGPLIEVIHEKGSFKCTANHPVWVENQGWVPAGLLKEGTVVRNLQRAASIKESGSNLFKVMLGKEKQSREFYREGSDQTRENTTQTVRENLKKQTGMVGQGIPLRHMSISNQPGQPLLLSDLCKTSRQTVNLSREGTIEKIENLQKNENCENRDSKPDGQSRNQRKGLQKFETSRGPVQTESRGERSDNQASTITLEGTDEIKTRLALEPRTCCSTWKSQRWVSNKLQTGYRKPEDESRNRVGRIESSESFSQRKGPEERLETEVSRVVSVKILESGDSGESCRESSIDNQYVYTLSVEAGSYFADGILVKNCQDLNRCQQELSLRAGKRLILVGDPKQAIFGFAGADANSIPRMQEILEKQPNGCVSYPLNVTRRCGKKIVAEAQKIVPDFYPMPNSHDGVIRTLPWSSPQEDSYRKHVEDGDMVLCRVNGPLVSQCFKFIREGKKAQIIGRDIGQGLIYLIKRMMKLAALDYQQLIYHPKMTSPTSLSELSAALDQWYEVEVAKESRKKVPSEGKVQALGDKRDCIECFINSEARNAADVVIKINQIFTDRTKDGIRMSSIHRAKGLEAHRVFFLNNPKDCPCPHPAAKSAWEMQQEHHLLYVAITRAINELIYVS